MNAATRKLSQLSHELSSLVNSAPAKAIARARASAILARSSLTDGQILKSGILIDAGCRIRNEPAISEGCDILRRLTAQAPDDHNLSYNLANGLVAKADVSLVKRPDWYLSTADLRREARSLFHKAAIASQSDDLKARAITNLGNALRTANRWVEAYDKYIEALKWDPTNGVAAMMAATVLLSCIDRGIGSDQILRSVAAKHLKSAKLNSERLRELAGGQAIDRLEALMGSSSDAPVLPSGALSEYERFVFENRFQLSLTIEGFALSRETWDSLKIPPFTERLVKGPNVPAIFAMFNVLKSDFLVARRLLFDAIYHPPKDTGSYYDTLDYAVYGTQFSMLTLAQRCCIDVLDKIANAVTEHLELGGTKQSVYFHNRWFALQSASMKKRSWQGRILKCVNSGNVAIIALAEIALDIEKQGFLWEKKGSRNAGTHRFVVLHDLGCQASRASAYVEHSGLEDFKQKTMESLRLARAAIIYFVELVALDERTRRKGVKAVPFVVLDHQAIRRRR